MTELVCQFVIEGYCQPKQRTFGRGFVTPPETRAYERLVGQLARVAMKGKPPYNGFCGLDVEIIHEIPKSWSRMKKYAAVQGKIFPTICDLDNQTKSISDAMNRIVFEDDRQVNHLVVRREYGAKDMATVRVFGIPVTEK